MSGLYQRCEELINSAASDDSTIIGKGDAQLIIDLHEARLASNLADCALEMYQMIQSLSNELYNAIGVINAQRLSEVNSQTETQPDLWDMESLHDAEILLAKARGEA